MKVQILGNIENELKNALSSSLSRHKNIKDVSDEIGKEVGYLNDTQIEYIKYSPIMNQMFSTPAIIKLKRSNVRHTINASLSNKKPVLKYSGVAHNILPSLFGYNRVSVESNLLYLKSTVSLFRINRSYGQKTETKKKTGVVDALASINKNVRNSLLINYVNVEAQIDKIKRSFGVEYAINSAMKIGVEAEKKDGQINSKAEMSANPVDHKYSKVIATAGVYREHKECTALEKKEVMDAVKSEYKTKDSYDYNAKLSLYFKFVYPIMDAKALCQSIESKLGSKKAGPIAYIQSLFRGKTSAQKTSSWLTHYFQQSTMHLQGEVESCKKVGVFTKETTSTAKALGMIKYAINNYGVMGGILVNIEESPLHSTPLAKSISPLLGLSYIPNSSIIDSASIFWPWDSIKKKNGILNKLYAFEINISKEY
ncbi:hypothetical protein NEMIN01_1297 [Nematocida minor]|uniref:uncharacterized protein n=1 Tax=Nematocida minor TaxID=1912983 RepID=UPI00221F9482|nr:uncharacterized protein NEMIN01_1297 [Nematocida minor]KAI5190964.1 hypothetical protein NEMIN01_1297 [Nematocida minor]